ncbi:pyridoxal phosphate-dependent aminotransferase [bacterium]|nr:pyridoxal phosphate-dependent aminotransferase [bacterium]
MPGIFSSLNLEPNSIERAKQQALRSKRRLLDLSNSDFAALGLAFPKSVLEQAATHYLATRKYQPDPQGLFALREKIAADYRRSGGLEEITAESIVITSSSSESYRLLFTLLCDAGDKILTPAVGYPLTEIIALDAKVEPKSFTLDLTLNYCPERIAQAYDAKARAVILVSPHNPTGAVVKSDLLELVPAEVALIADQVFFPYQWHTNPRQHAGSLIKNRPVFHLGGLSKQFGLPDLKLGWIAMNQVAKDLYLQRLAFLNDTYLSASYLVQNIAIELFSPEGSKWTELLHKRCQENITRAQQLLSSVPELDCPLPDGGCFLFPKVLLENFDSEKFALSLLGRGILVHPGYFYGDRYQSHLFLSILANLADLESGIKTISDTILTS